MRNDGPFNQLNQTIEIWRGNWSGK